MENLQQPCSERRQPRHGLCVGPGLAYNDVQPFACNGVANPQERGQHGHTQARAGFVRPLLADKEERGAERKRPDDEITGHAVQKGKDDPGPRLGPPDRVQRKLQQLPAKIEAGEHQGSANEDGPTHEREARSARHHVARHGSIIRGAITPDPVPALDTRAHRPQVYLVRRAKVQRHAEFTSTRSEVRLMTILQVWRPPMRSDALITRRTVLTVLAVPIVLSSVSKSWAQGLPRMTVTKDPSCGCCSGWVRTSRRPASQLRLSSPRA